MDVWIDAEARGCQFPDERLRKRFRKVMESLSNKLGNSLPLACQDWAATKAAYRFLDNPRVDHDPRRRVAWPRVVRVAMLEPECAAWLYSERAVAPSPADGGRAALRQARIADNDLAILLVIALALVRLGWCTRLAAVETTCTAEVSG